jgi:heme/copper-type cytochrome/quinol oxidase subunit 3
MLKTPIKLGMVLFILSESVFFLLLVIAYIVYHVKGGNGPTAAQSLDSRAGLIFSFFLFASSFTVWRAHVNMEKKRRTRFASWLGATILFGAVFLFGQGREYAGLIKQDVTISRDLFGTTFFTATGFHGLHVFTGLILLSIMISLAIFGRKTEPTQTAFTAIGYYWHFVDAVWVVLFSVIYLWAFV